VADPARLPAGDRLLVWVHLRVCTATSRTCTPSWNEEADIYPPTGAPGRGLSAVIGALQVPLVFQLGQAAGSLRSAYLAAIFLAVSFGPLRDAHWALIEPLLLLGIVATLLALLWALERPTLLRFALVGLLAGLDTTPSTTPPPWRRRLRWRSCWTARRRQEHPGHALGTREAGWRRWRWCSASFAGSPYILISRRSSWGDEDARVEHRDASFGTDVGFVHHLLFSLRHSHGLLMEAVGITGLLLLVWKRPGRMLVAAYGFRHLLRWGRPGLCRCATRAAWRPASCWERPGCSTSWRSVAAARSCCSP
jgi:hypothetical protein